MTDPFEDEVRAAMRAHDSEAPTQLTLRPRSRRRVTWPAVVAAAAVVALVAVLATVVSSERSGDGPHEYGGTAGVSTPDTSLDCPARYHGSDSQQAKPWVPAAATIPGSADELAPRRVPTDAVVCAYFGRNHGDSATSSSVTSLALSGRREILRDLETIPASLSLQPEEIPGHGFGCGEPGMVSEGYEYLLGLRYAHGYEWVAIPGDGCRSATNGAFTALNGLPTYPAYAYRTGRWVVDPPPEILEDPRTVPKPVPDGPCDAGGRLGQERHLVPGRPISVTICAGVDSSHVTRTEGASAARRLASALDALPTRPSDHGGSGAIVPGYLLVFRYRYGPAVAVSVTPKLRPPVDNSSLQATTLSSVVLDLVR